MNIICPTNHYSSEGFNSYKNSLILVKQGDYYEPIYSYTNEETNIRISKLFNEHSPNLSSNLKNVLFTLKEIYNKCAPLDSMPNVYIFKNNIT